MADSNRCQASGHIGENQEKMIYRNIAVRQYPG